MEQPAPRAPAAPCRRPPLGGGARARPVTFVVTQGFLDHFGLESARDLPGVKELRAAGLLDSRPMPGATPADAEEEAVTGQSELFED